MPTIVTRGQGGLGGCYLLEVSQVLWFLEVLQVAEVGYKVGPVEQFLGSEVIEIGGIGKTLDELGWARQRGQKGGRRCVEGRTSSSSSKREKPP